VIRKIIHYTVRCVHNKICQYIRENRNMILNITGRMHHHAHNTATSIKRHSWRLTSASHQYDSAPGPKLPIHSHYQNIFPLFQILKERNSNIQILTLLLPIVTKLGLFRTLNCFCLAKAKVKVNISCTVTLNVQL
jgi:hypothetical protein